MDAKPFRRPAGRGRRLLITAAALAAVAAATLVTVAQATSPRAHTPAADTSYLTAGATAARRTAAPVRALAGLGTVLPNYSCAQLASEDFSQVIRWTNGACQPRGTASRSRSRPGGARGQRHARADRVPAGHRPT